MAISRNKLDEIPTDAIRISEEEALTYQWKIVSGWEKITDVWALRYSSGILATLAAGTGIFINNHYRAKLKLGTYGKLSTYLPIVAVPAMFSILAHKTLVQRELLLDPLKNCPLCLQIRAAGVQAGLGVVYPTILAPFAAFMFATRHFTYRLPSITAEPLEVFKLWRKMTKPVAPTLGTILALQAAIAMFITSQEQKQSYFVLRTLRELEQKAELDLSDVQSTSHVF